MALGAMGVGALNNGLGMTPQMGYNSWYDVRMSPSANATLATAAALLESGLYELGYHYVNLDDGIVVGRYDNGTLQPDPKFPDGMRQLSDDLHSKGFKFGIYTDRGPKTCGGRPSAQGYEKIDADTYANDWQVGT